MLNLNPRIVEHMYLFQTFKMDRHSRTNELYANSPKKHERTDDGQYIKRELPYPLTGQHKTSCCNSFRVRNCQAIPRNLDR